jgi:uncharacterized membrane protein (UPF0127 family)
MELTLEGVIEAKSFGARLLGLMGRRSWPCGHRGIFFRRCRSVHTFLTFLKPDLLFLNENNQILDINPSAASWRIFFGPKGATHCLELPSGSVKAQGLGLGDTVRFLR